MTTPDDEIERRVRADIEEYGWHVAKIEGDEAKSRCYCRVMHLGKNEHEAKTFESFIEYSDELVRADPGWRSRKRIARVFMNLGDPAVLGPG